MVVTRGDVLSSSLLSERTEIRQAEQAIASRMEAKLSPCKIGRYAGCFVVEAHTHCTELRQHSGVVELAAIVAFCP